MKIVNGNAHGNIAVTLGQMEMSTIYKGKNGFILKHLYIIYLKTTFATKLDKQIQDKITFTKHKNPKAIYSSDFSKRNFHLGSMSTEFISTEQNWSAARVFAKCSLVASLPPVA